jgi:hypothetical protein
MRVQGQIGLIPEGAERASLVPRAREAVQRLLGAGATSASAAWLREMNALCFEALCPFRKSVIFRTGADLQLALGHRDGDEPRC